MTENQPQKKEKKRPGRKPGVKVKHGAYSLMVQRRTDLRVYLQAARDGLIEDLGPREADLTTAQLVLVDRAISKLSAVRCIEEYIKKVGVFKGGELNPVMAKSYITYCESIRRDLEALGISKRVGERVLSPLEIAAEIDAEKADKQAQPDQLGRQDKNKGEDGHADAEPIKIDPGATSSQIQKPEEVKS